MKPFQRWYGTGFILLLAALLAGAFGLYRWQEQQLRHKAEATLLGIAQLKTQQISLWVRDRLSDASLIMENSFLIDAMRQWQEKGDQEFADAMLGQFTSLRSHLKCDDVALVGVKGNVLLGMELETDILHTEVSQAVLQAIELRQPVITDLHPGARGDKIHVDVIAPLFTRKDDQVVPLGAIVMRNDADSFLYPLIQSWPLKSDTAESLIVRRDGDSVLFLNEIRHRSNTALKLRLPMTRADLPAVMAAKGRRGIVRGRDYRDIEVLAALEDIPGTPWLMVAKVDVSEAMAEWRTRSNFILLLSGAFVIALFALAGILWHRRSGEHFRQLFEAESARRMLDRRFRTTLLSIGDGVIAVDHEGRVEFINQVGEVLTGWRAQLAEGREVSEVFNLVDDKTGQTLLEEGDCTPENLSALDSEQATIVARNGQRKVVSTTATPIRDESGEILGTVLVFRDESMRLLMEKDKDQLVRTLEDRVRKLRCLFELGRLGERPNTSMNDLMADAVELIPPAWQNPRRTCAGIRIHQNLWTSANYAESACSLSAPIRIMGQQVGSVAVFFAESAPEAAAAFNQEDELLEMLAATLGRIAERFLMDEALKDSEQRLRITMEAAASGIGQASLDGGWLQVNPMLCEILGYGREELLALKVENVTYAADLDKDADLLQQVRDGEIETYNLEKRFVRRGGEIIWVHLSVGAIQDENKRPASLVFIVDDITRRREVEQRLRRIEWLLSGEHNENGDIVQPSYGRLSESSTNRLIQDSVGEEYLAAIAGDYLDLLGTAGSIFERDGSYAFRACSSGWCNVLDEAGRRLCGDRNNTQAMACGKWLCHESNWALASCKVIETGLAVDVACAGGLRLIAEPIFAGGEVVGTVNVGYGDPPKDPEIIRDIAAQYHVDPKLLLKMAEDYESRPPFIIEVAKRRLRTSADLIGRIVERRLSEDALRESRQQLERSNEELEQFAFIASHDLQEPLRTAEGYASLLQGYRDESMTEDVGMCLDGVSRGIEQMQAIVDGVLAVSRVASASLEIGSLDLNEVLQEAIAGLAASIASCDAEITVETLPTVEADRRLMSRVFQNLLENAMKYRGEDTPRIRVYAEAHEDVQRIMVDDNGLGIPQDQAGRLFKLFGRLGQRGDRPGSGIGLAMCKKIVELHGGHIWFESEVGKGTTFIVELSATHIQSAPHALAV